MNTIESLTNTITKQAEKLMALAQQVVDRDNKIRALEDELADLRRQVAEQK